MQAGESGATRSGSVGKDGREPAMAPSFMSRTERMRRTWPLLQPRTTALAGGRSSDKGAAAGDSGGGERAGRLREVEDGGDEAVTDTMGIGSEKVVDEAGGSGKASAVGRMAAGERVMG